MRALVLNLAQNVAQFGAQNSKCLLNCTPGSAEEGGYPAIPRTHPAFPNVSDALEMKYEVGMFEQA